MRGCLLTSRLPLKLGSSGHPAPGPNGEMLAPFHIKSFAMGRRGASLETKAQLV